ncbi:MAG: Gfo/Idh/MocA family oxidoreductase [Chloroflexota bacterium]
MEGDRRALIVGSGYAGTKHADALDELGIPFNGPLSARSAMEDPRALEDPAVTVVHVCAANDLHVALAGRALRAGKDVVCEKPLALDVSGAEELVALAHESGRLAVLAYNYRFHPLVVELATRVAFLGPLHAARGSFLQDWLLLATDANWRVEETQGGASRAIADIGVHWLDLVELASGQRVVAVTAQIGRLHGRPTEDHAGVLLRFSNGMTGSVVLSQAAAGHRNDLELSLDGSMGSATWRHDRPNELWLGSRVGEAVEVRRGDELLSPAARTLAALPAGPNEARRNLLAAVYARLAGDDAAPAAPLPTFDDGLRHARFAAAALESASREKWVSVG